MRKIFNIDLHHNNKKIAKCDYIILEPYATSTGRKFFFHNLKFKTKEDLLHMDKIQIRILFHTKYYEIAHICDFNILLTNYDYKGLEWVYGLIYNDYEEEYKQGLIDVFYAWEKGEKIDWFSLSMNSYLKNDYILACLYYSGVSTEIIDKEIYTIDMLLVREYRDILYLVSEEFFGERGYMGHSFHTISDCLLCIFNKVGYLDNKTIIFKNTKSLFIEDDPLFFEDLKKKFMIYKFSVIVEE